MQVPIYTYKDSDFEIPIFLRYNSSGFQPSQREGIVGLNWSLNAGGVITRTVNGVPDDTQASRTTSNYELDGLFYGVKNNLAVKNTSKTSIFNLSVGTIESNGYWHIGFCEVEPDLFTFNVPGLSGKFYIQNNGEVKCVGSKPFKVDLSGVSIQQLLVMSDNVLPSSIKVTTDDGYVYDFGGTIDYLDVAFLISDGQAINPLINTWHLTKIVAPNGRSVDYFYKDFVQGIANDEIPNDTSHYLYQENVVRITNSDHIAQSFGGYASSSASWLSTPKSATKTTYLDRIEVNSHTTIQFIYEGKERKFYDDYSPFNQRNYRLKRLEVSDFEDNLRKAFDFSYAYHGGTHPRMFLASLQERDPQEVESINPYTFSYYDTSILPNPTTGSVDHWGFWNSNNSVVGAVVPDMHYHSNGNVDITGNQRDPDGSKFRTALLEKITYPTLGYTRFIYERHQYSKRLERRNDYDFLPKLYNVSDFAGGARISRVEEFDGVSTTNIKEYKYTIDYPSGSESSGILMDWPRYLFRWDFNGGGSGVTRHLRVKSTSFNRNHSGLDNFIMYSEVTELQPGNGFVVHKFTDYETNPDENDYNTQVLDPSIHSFINNVHLWNSYVGIKFNDKHFERGILYSTSYFKFTGSGSPILQKKISMDTEKFTDPSDFLDAFIVGAHLTGGVIQSFKRYFYPFMPKEIEEVHYDENGNNPFKIIRQRDFNTYGYLIKESVTQSDGTKVSKHISYPMDYASASVFINDMKLKNQLVHPIEQVQYIERNGEIQVVSGNIHKYKTGGKGYIDESLRLETEDPIPLSSFKFSSRDSAGVVPPDGSASLLLPDSRYKPEIKYDQYDSFGNVLQYTVNGNQPIGLIWGYLGSYPIAKVVGSDHLEIAYTSFEVSDQGGNWTYNDLQIVNDATSPAGKKAFALSGGNNLQKGELNSSKRYIVSYWRKGGSSSSVSVSGTQTINTGNTVNGWTYEEKTITGVTEILLSGNIRVDEVRLFPEGTVMTTYLYDHLVGMTVQRDGRNYGLNYEYDGVGRLKSVRNERNELLEHYEYNYGSEN